MILHTVEKGFAQKYINTNNTSAAGKIVKSNTEVLLMYPGDVDVKISPPYIYYGESYRQ